VCKRVRLARRQIRGARRRHTPRSRRPRARPRRATGGVEKSANARDPTSRETRARRAGTGNARTRARRSNRGLNTLRRARRRSRVATEGARRIGRAARG
jgi:hypothetical protein